MNENLNLEQQEAVLETEGYIRVIAGAGTGKTRTLASRFAYLVNDLGILPGNIFCVTFTNKAAAQMRSRIHKLTGDKDTGILSTFHGFCAMVLKEEIHHAGWPKSFLVMDNPDIDQILRTIYEERGLNLRHMTFAKARDLFEQKKIVLDPDYYRRLLYSPVPELRQLYEQSEAIEDILFHGYLYYSRKVFGLDYNDLIVITLHLFEQLEEVRTRWQSRLEYIMVDEVQDIDQLQYRLMKVLAGIHHNLFVVGDPDQSIYSWRGGSLRYLLDFDNDFPNVKTITLNRNYRSTPQILDTANSLIACNTVRLEKSLTAVKGKGPRPHFVYERTRKKEMDRLVQYVKDLTDMGVSLRDMAVLYRAHHMSRLAEEAFLEAGIPYVLWSGTPFYERREVKDSLSWLRMLIYRNDLDFERTINVPRRGMGRQKMHRLKELAQQTGKSLFVVLQEQAQEDWLRSTGAQAYVDAVESVLWEERPVSEVLADILVQSGYESMLRMEGDQVRLDNLAELKQAAVQLEQEWGELLDARTFLERSALAGLQDQPEGQEAVKFLSIHTAKGLEFDHVFLIGMNEGLFPSKKCRTPESTEEERRLCFVGMTRARESLVCLANQEDGHPSRFLLEPLEQTVNYVPDVQWAKEPSYRVSLKFLETAKVWPEGTRVRHPIFGAGTIEKTDPAAGAWTIRFDDLATCRTLSFKAKLEKEVLH